MEKDIKKRGPGQPKKKNKIIDRFSLKFRANYPHLKETLTNLKNKSTSTCLNDYIIEILNHYVNIHTSHEKAEKMEAKFKRIIQNINLKINEFKSKTKVKWPHPIETMSFNELITKFFPNPIEKTIFCLKFLESSIYTEFELLYTLLTLSPFELDNPSIKNYIDYIIERDNLPEGSKKKILDDLIRDFLNTWFFELESYNVIADRKRFEICSDKVEDFILTIMYPELETKPLFDESEYNQVQKEWEQILKKINDGLQELNSRLNLPNINYNMQFNFENAKMIWQFLNGLLKELTSGNSLGLTRREFKKFMNQWKIKEGLINKEIQSVKKAMKSIIGETNDINDHERSIKLIEELDFPKDLVVQLEKYKTFFSILKEINLIRQSFNKNTPKYNMTPLITHSHLKKQEFIQHINYYYDFSLKNHENEYNISSFPYYDIFFYPFILNNILDLDGYYEYLKKNNIIIDFYPKDEDLRKKLEI